MGRCRMRIGITSDTHCEFDQPFPPIPSDIGAIILAGDIGDPYTTKEHLQRLDIPYFYIAGNHEFYGYRHEDVIKDIFNNTEGCYENGTMEIGGVRIHGCTLWTDLLDNGVPNYVGYDHFMNDRRCITGWSGTQSVYHFHESVKFLRDNVKEGDVVVTHHLPSYRSVHPKYAGDAHNHMFASNLDELVEELKPSLLIHGHTHEPVDYMIGYTRVLCSPRGYPHEQGAVPYGIKVIDL